MNGSAVTTDNLLTVSSITRSVNGGTVNFSSIPSNQSVGEASGRGDAIMAVWDEPKELDTDNEAVISLYDGIRKILDRQTNPKPKQEKKISSTARHILQCGKILKVEVERRLIIVTVMKKSGELHELRIQASDD
jgi:hypothetical protein